MSNTQEMEQELLQELNELGRHYQRVKSLQKAINQSGAANQYQIEVRDVLVNALG